MRSPFFPPIIIAVLTCFLQIAFFVGSIISSPIVGGMRHPVYGDSIVVSFLIHFESIWRSVYYLKRTA